MLHHSLPDRGDCCGYRTATAQLFEEKFREQDFSGTSDREWRHYHLRDAVLG